jgi:predicted enzyme related to lactoylglutathione lyase
MKQMPVVHFEMPSIDNTRCADFYTNAFGWKMNQLGSEMSNYLIAETSETDENRMVKTPGTINGGFFPRKDDEQNRAPHLVIAVDDIEASRKAVEDAGGQVMGEKMDIPGIGQYYSFKDTEGNIVGMLQAHKRESTTATS